jgi:L-methionine (R)-S-oxide reductase
MAEAQSARAGRERQVLESVRRAPPDSLDALLEQVVTELHGGFPHYTGVYLYWMDGRDALALRTYRGRPTEHTRIPLDRGICGRAARERRTVIVDDVQADPSYLACSLETRSEIVVPIMRDGAVLGEIDIDGDDRAAYNDADRRFLEALASLIAARA